MPAYVRRELLTAAQRVVCPRKFTLSDYTKSFRKLFEQALARRLRKGVSDGDLPPGTNVKELAAYFGTIFRGMAVRARDGASRKQLLAICRVAMRAWPSRPPDSNGKTADKGSPPGRHLLTSL